MNFSLNVEPAPNGDDLVVTIVNGKGEECGTHRLAGDNSVPPYAMIYPMTVDGVTTYTIPNVTLANGETISLKVTEIKSLGLEGYILSTAIESSFVPEKSSWSGNVGM